MAIQYRIPVLETFSFQPPVSGVINDPPVSPVKGARYIVEDAPTGAFVGHTDAIAWYDGSLWKFDTPTAGYVTYRLDIEVFVSFTTVWGPMKSGFDGDMLKSVYDTDNDGIVDAAEQAAVAASAGQVSDGTNTSTAEEIRDAVDKKHAHSNKATLDAIEEAFTTVLKTAYDTAVTEAHTHLNKSVLDSVEEAFTTVLKTNYNIAVERMGSYDADLGVILMNL